MKFLVKKKLKSLISYFSTLNEPALILGFDMHPIFINHHAKAIEGDDMMEKVMDFLFSSNQPFDRYLLERQFLKKYRVHTIIFRSKNKESSNVALGKEFVANASHELRTPITIIKGFAETLLDIEDVSKEMLGSIILKIVNSCNRMQGLVKNLLLLSDLDQTSHLKKTSVEIMTLVEKAIEELLLVYPNARVECFYSKDPVIMEVNQELFILAIFNILQNAMKYSKKDPLIEVIVTRDKKGLFIAIKDNGMGMPESQLERIFKRFITVDKSHSRKLGGAGLGLSLVDAIIHRHGGTIQVQSRIDEGTQVTFHFA